MFPKLSTPLAKAWRTSEGIAFYVINAALLVGTLVDPTRLTPKEAGILASINLGLHTAQRGLIKAVAVTRGLGVGAPIPFDMQALTDEVAAKVGAKLPQISTAHFKQALNDALKDANLIASGHTAQVPGEVVSQVAGVTPQQSPQP